MAVSSISGVGSAVGGIASDATGSAAEQAFMDQLPEKIATDMVQNLLSSPVNNLIQNQAGDSGDA